MVFGSTGSFIDTVFAINPIPTETVTNDDGITWHEHVLVDLLPTSAVCPSANLCLALDNFGTLEGAVALTKNAGISWTVAQPHAVSRPG